MLPLPIVDRREIGTENILAGNSASDGPVGDWVRWHPGFAQHLSGKFFPAGPLKK
jgi:hypothetical protein